MTAHLSDADAPAVDQPNPDVTESLADTLMDLVPRKTGQLAARVGDDHLRLSASEGRKCPVPQSEQLVIGAHRAGSTRTLRKRHGAAPWPTCIDCDGWPLPQFTTPNICHSEGPATASHDPQNSGVWPL